MKETRAAGKAIGVKDMGEYERVAYLCLRDLHNVSFRVGLRSDRSG